MFNKLALAGLIILLVVGTTAQAQTKPSPSPAPSPAPGTRAYTEQAFDAYNKALQNYEVVCAKPDADLDAMDAASSLLYDKQLLALSAARQEALTLSDVKAMFEAYAVAESTYERISAAGKDYEAELKAKSARDKAYDAAEAARRNAMQKIYNAVNDGKAPTVVVAKRHRELLEHPADAERVQAEKKKAEAEKKSQVTPNGSSQKTSCPSGGGITAQIEGVACQDRNAGH